MKVLEHDQIGLQGAQISAQIIDAQQHLVRHDEALVHAAQQLNGLVEGGLGALEMEGGHAHRNIGSLEAHGFPPEY